MKSIIYVLTGLLLSCQVTHYEQTGNAGWIENGAEVYPRYEMYRTKKDIQLPLSLQQAVSAYRIKFGFFPPSAQAFIHENELNLRLIKNLYTQGFTKIEFLSLKKDTLAVEFEFMKKGSLYYDTYASITLSPTNSGRFLFISTPDGYIYCKRYIDKWGQRSKWWMK